MTFLECIAYGFSVTIGMMIALGLCNALGRILPKKGHKK